MRLRSVVSTGLILLPTLAAVSSARAQSAAPLAPRRIGIAAGINLATFGGKDAKDPKPTNRVGVIGGAFLVIPVNPSFAIQPELLYTMRGAHNDQGADKSEFKINYLEIPVLVRFDVPTSGGVRPFILAGPSVSLKVSCDIQASNSSFTPAFSQTSSCDELESQFGGPKFRAVDDGLIIGGGLAFDMSGRAVSVGARYDYSLRRIVPDTDVRNRVISVLATIEFPWRK